MKEEEVIDRIIQSYRTDGPFMVLTDRDLTRIFKKYGLDPKSTDPTIFAVESLAHFLQTGVVKLFQQLSITKQDKVLSLGDGNGAPSRLLAKLIGCSILGVDVSPLQLSKAKRCSSLHGVEHLVDYVLQNVHSLDLGDLVFDKVYANETMCHWNDKEQALRRVRRHMRPGALIGINEWLIGDQGDLNDAVYEISGFEEMYKKDIWFQNDIEELYSLLESLGFSIKSAEEVTDEVDRDMRMRLEQMALLFDEVARRGVQYYQIMLKTHYRFLRYGRIVAQAS